MTEDFMQPGNNTLLEESVLWIERYGQDLTDDQCRRLYRVAEQHITINSQVPFDQEEDDGEELDVRNEIGSLLRAIRGLRRKIMSDDGQIMEGHDTRDAKEIVSSSSQMITLLLRSEEKIDYMSRMQAIERAAVETVRTLPEEQQEQFFSQLERTLDQDVPTK